MPDTLDRLYRLLPAIYRELERVPVPPVPAPPVPAARVPDPLRDLLQLVTEQADIVRDDVRQLWDDFFIETCRRWVIPYIGDLVGNNLLHDGTANRSPDTARSLFPDLVGRDLRPGIAIRTRADVAKTIYYRRRKGTLPMLEELARDVTGWAAHAVEFFELLDWSQNMNHVRLHSTECPDLRSVERVDRVDGPFDEFSHAVDVRAIAQAEGWHNIRNIGFFPWRLRSYPATRVVARPAAFAWQYHFSPLGHPAPLFTRQRREGDEVRQSTELDVPAPIRPAAFYEDLVSGRREYYGVGPEASFVIHADGVLVDPPRIHCRDLAGWMAPGARPAGNLVMVDVRRGRIVFGDASTPGRVDVTYHYGFSGDVGGGPYGRASWLVRPELAALRLEVEENAVPPRFATLDDALAEWSNQGRPNTIVTILDNRTYTPSAAIELADDRWLVIEAADGVRPHVIPALGELLVIGDHPGAELTLSGLLVEGAVRLTGDLARMRILHTTLVPGRALDAEGLPATQEPSLVVEGGGATPINTSLRVEIAYSITGPLRIPAHAQGLWLLDSIVDGLLRPDGTRGIALAADDTPAPGPPATLERVTVLGTSHLRQLPLASETIFTGRVEVMRRQDGCVRFSFVPSGSSTPRRYRCQPDLEVAAAIARLESRPGFALQPEAVQLAEKARIRGEVMAWLAPSFTADRYGLPAYAQLRLGSPRQISTGAEDGSEMGVFSHLKQPQRETNLLIRLDEYLPFGLEAGVIYVT
jgi:hypothetical protein